MGDFLAAHADQQLRIETAEGNLELAVVGGDVEEDALAGIDHLRGLDGLVEFLISSRR